jgi:hypothetical protein
MYLQACVLRRYNLCTPNQDVLLLANVGLQIRFRAHIQLIAQNTDPYKLMVCSEIAFDRATAEPPHYWYDLDYVFGFR